MEATSVQAEDASANVRFRIGTNGIVHREDDHSEHGISAACGKLAPAGSYTVTTAPLTCSRCLRTLGQRGYPGPAGPPPRISSRHP